MSTELKIPEVGESITEVQISEWLKSEGDEVKADEAVAVIDSEKTTFELPAPQSGRLTKILHQAGDTVKVGEVVAQLDADGEAAKEKPKAAKEESKPKAEPKAASEAQPEEKTAKKQKPVEKSPEEKSESADLKKEPSEDQEQKKIAPADTKTERAIALKPEEKDAPESKPTTSNKVTKATPSPGREEEVVPMTMLRRTVAHRLVEARQNMAMLTTFNEVDMSGIQALRKEHSEAFEKRYKVRLGLMSFFVKGAIDALKQFPKLNAEIRETDIIYRNYFDIGVAIATERGLVVPVLRDAETLSFAETEKAIGDFAQRARENKLKPDEFAGGTFTITNGGVFGSLLSTPIINPPQTGILGMHTIQERPVVVAGQIIIRPMMYLALTYDHRLVDGREAVLFLHRVKEVIENPARMLVEI